VPFVDTSDTADFNRDGVLDAADYVIWRKQAGQSAPGLAADADGDDDVDEFDLGIWRASYGASSTSGLLGGGATVPEPAAFLIAMFAVSALLSSRAASC